MSLFSALRLSNKIGLTACLALGLAVTAGLLATPAAAADGVWQHNYQRAMAQAKREQRPLVLHFHASWCGPCQQMEATVLNQPRIRELLSKSVIGVKIDSDAHSSLVSKYGVTGLPTDVFVGPDGKVLSRRVGKTSLDAYAKRLDDVGGQYARPVAVAAEVLDGADVEQAVLGLEGYSPVSLADSSEWVVGKEDLSLVYRGIRYRFADTEQKSAFRNAPEKYAPKHLGCDPMELFKTGNAVAGDIRFGAVYKGKIFLMSTADNQKKFVADPQIYAGREYALDVKDVKKYALAK